MTDIRLKSLVIENFRSLRGRVVVPLDAQVVLIHGTNGMGKTSVLSALELGLTGKIAHLAADGDSYKSYLTTLNTGEGSITLATTAPHCDGGGTNGSLVFRGESFTTNPLLEPIDARFFAERCYLPQAKLGRLLEIYDDQKAGSTSPLTLFVKELLGLEPLDALVDGLDPAFHVARVRKVAPDYRRLEALKTSVQEQLNRGHRVIIDATNAAKGRQVRINEILAEISSSDQVTIVTDATNLAQLRLTLSEAYEHDRRLTDLTRVRSELRGVLERWQILPSEDASRNQADLGRVDHAAAQALAAWRSGAGSALDRAVGVVRTIFADVPSLDDDPEKGHAEALRRAIAEEARCDKLLRDHTTAIERINSLKVIVQRATSRIDELNQDLASSAKDAKTLANALAGVVPHISEEVCPVCDRDFADKDAGPLSAHVAAKIASLTSTAGRLQALATERAEESNRLAVAQRDLLSAGNGQLSSDAFAESTVRKMQMADSVRQLQGLASAAGEGRQLMIVAIAARQALIFARRRDDLSISLLPEIETIVQLVVGHASSSFSSIDQALAEAMRLIDSRVVDAERIAALRIEGLSELDRYMQDLKQIQVLRADREHGVARMASVDNALRMVDACRDQAKRVSGAADTVRSEIVKKVFNTSLNKVWRDLFVRLAPSEQFVPAFKIPSSIGGKVEAVLETMHRSGVASGSPGAMLSQGNLNTAALTLFLALHLSVPARIPWLVLDDPVQSMDDVHIAQFAALLRSLSKGMGRQVVVAVHERALFDYLTLELSPAFPGDSLIAVEITRNFEGEAVVTPRVFGFEDDRAFAA